MRAATRALAVISLGGALVLSSAAMAVAAPCPVGTYPPGQSCTISSGTTNGQVSGSTGSTGSSSGSSTGSSTGSTTGTAPAPSATPEAVIGTPEPATSPAPEATSGTGTGSGTQAGGPAKADSALSPTAYALGTAGLVLLIGLLVFLLARRRTTAGPSAH